jgi:hypothetical protein
MKKQSQILRLLTMAVFMASGIREFLALQRAYLVHRLHALKSDVA